MAYCGKCLHLDVCKTAETCDGHVPRCKHFMDKDEHPKLKHGRWEPHYETFDADMSVGILGGNYQTGWQCSVCGRYEPSKEPYCNCGARMDGDGQ